MINIVHLDIHCDNNKKITAVDVKLRSFEDLTGHPLRATVSAAFYKTTFLSDTNGELICPPGDREDIVDITVDLKKSDKVRLTFEDIARFANAFQNSLDNTHLGF